MSERGSMRGSGPADAAACNTVLVVVSQPWLHEATVAALRASGFIVLSAAGLAEAEAIAASVVPDAVVLDLGGEEGAALDRLVAQRPAEGVSKLAAVVLCGGRCGDAAAAGVAGICLRKPVQPRQVVVSLLKQLHPESQRARARPHELASGAEKVPSLVCGPLALFASRPVVQLSRDGAVVEFGLAPREHALLLALLQRPGRVQSREELCDAVWGRGSVNVRTVDQYVRRLRRSLEAVGLGGLVRTVNTVGYCAEPAVLRAPEARDDGAGACHESFIAAS
jgi:two-component system, OmpR family, phosphate regulon response regulator PhoB